MDYSIRAFGGWPVKILHASPCPKLCEVGFAMTRSCRFVSISSRVWVWKIGVQDCGCIRLPETFLDFCRFRTFSFAGTLYCFVRMTAFDCARNIWSGCEGGRCLKALKILKGLKSCFGTFPGPECGKITVPKDRHVKQLARPSLCFGGPGSIL